MSTTDKQPRVVAPEAVAVDLADLGTISAEQLVEGLADPQRRQERDRVLDAFETLERDGRLLLG